MKGCGQHLSEVSPKGTNAVFERFRTILHEGDVDKNFQYMIDRANTLLEVSPRCVIGGNCVGTTVTRQDSLHYQ